MSVEIVEASNPYQAAIAASQRVGADVEIESVVPAVGRPPQSSRSRSGTPKAAKKVTNKRRPMSAENRAKLAQNLVKARAARAAKRGAPAKRKAVAKKVRAKRR
jgi:hypothetical protein